MKIEIFFVRGANEKGWRGVMILLKASSAFLINKNKNFKMRPEIIDKYQEGMGKFIFALLKNLVFYNFENYAQGAVSGVARGVGGEGACTFLVRHGSNFFPL